MNPGSDLTTIIDLLWQLWPAMLAGLLITLAGTWGGWLLACHRSLAPVRLIQWWVTHVVIRLVRSQSWTKRTSAIFINNSAICAATVALGHWAWTAWAAVATIGFSLGIGLRLMAHAAVERSFVDPPPSPPPVDGRSVTDTPAPHPTTPSPRAWTGRATRIGIALNLLEPPAIIIALGLCLGQRAMYFPMSPYQLWTAFAVLVVPALLLAAAGEALWLGALHNPDPE